MMAKMNNIKASTPIMNTPSPRSCCCRIIRRGNSISDKGSSQLRGQSSVPRRGLVVGRAAVCLAGREDSDHVVTGGGVVAL